MYGEVHSAQCTVRCTVHNLPSGTQCTIYGEVHNVQSTVRCTVHKIYAEVYNLKVEFHITFLTHPTLPYGPFIDWTIRNSPLCGTSIYNNFMFPLKFMKCRFI